MSFSSSKLFEDDDEDLSTSTRKSNLGNLFGAATQPTSKDSSLAYQRPKAPTKGEASTAKGGSKSNLPPLLYTTRVDLYKTGTNPPEYVQIGAAIVENTTGTTKFNLILYLTREKVMAMVSISRDFVLTLQLQDGTHFGSFYDSNQKLWSFRFLKPEDVDQLAIYVTVARHCEEPGQVLTQEIGAATKGTGAVKDDILGVRYVSYSVKQGKLSDAIEDNTNKPQPTKYVMGGVNKTAFPGAEVGLDGMKRGGRRVLLVPNEGDGSAMVYKLFLEKMKKAAPTESAPSSGKLPRGATSGNESDSGASVTNVSETPEPGSPVGDNSNTILQRMSKMAVATPFAGGGIKSSLATDSTTVSTTEPAAPIENPVQTATQTPASPNVAQTAQPQQQFAQQSPMQSQTGPQGMYQGMQTPYGQPQMGQGQQMGAFGGMGPGMPGMNGYGAAGAGAFGMGAAAGMGGAFGANGAFGGMGSPAASMYANQNALSLYNPQQQQQMMWDLQHGPGSWAAAHAGVPMGPPQAVPTAAAKPAESSSTTSSSGSASTSSKDVLSQAEAIQLLIDGRQFQSEIKSSLTRMSTQLEDVEERLEGTMFTKNKDLGGGVTAKVLLQTIARIVGENERMLEELATRDERIEQLTTKMNKLHDTNQRMVDENNRFMEERTTNFKSATDSQLRQLETFREEKTALEMELTSANRQFQTLKRSYTNVSTELETLKEEMERLKTDRDLAVAKFAGVAGASQSAESKLIEEQSARRKLELDVQQLRDELATERETVDTLRRDAEDRKTRFSRETANVEQHHIAEKATYEDQITKLQEALRKERASVGSTAEQAASEIESKWTARYQSETQRFQSALEAETEAKLEQHRAAIETAARERVKQIKEAHAEQLATTVSEAETERSSWHEKEQAFRRHIAQLQEVALSTTEAQEVISRLRAEIAESASNSVTSIKTIMNQVYVSLNDLFEEGEQVQYNKIGIMDTLKRMIIATTKRVTNPNEELQAVAKPEPVAPIRIEVPVEVRVEVPVEVPVAIAAPAAEAVSSSSAPVSEKSSVEHVIELQHPENPLLDRVDSGVSIEVRVVAQEAPEKTEKDESLDDDPLAASQDPSDEIEDSTPKYPGPVDDGWESLDRNVPDFIQPEEVAEEKPAEQIDEPISSPNGAAQPEQDPLSSSTADVEDVDPLSASMADASDDEKVESPLAVDEPVISEPISVAEPAAEEEKPVENPLAVDSQEVDEEENPLSASQKIEEEPIEKVEETVTEVTPAAEDEPVNDSETISASWIPSAPQEPVNPDPFGVEDEEDEVVRPVQSSPAVEVPVVDAPVASAVVDGDDDPFGVNEEVKTAEPVAEIVSTPAAVAAPEADDDDPFGVNEPKESNGVTETVEAEKPSPVEEVPAERPASPPNFFLDASETNGTTAATTATPIKKSSSFFDDDEEEETKKHATPATAPPTAKKSSSSFFDDEDDLPVAPAKKAPSSASKAFSFGDDDDDSFGAPKTKSKQSNSALDDIFGGISSGGGAAKKGLFDD